MIWFKENDVNSPRTFQNVALQARIERLKFEEQDLARRVVKRMTALEAENRWHKSDPLYQRLSSVLEGIRDDLRSAHKELARRADERVRHAVCATTKRARRTSVAQIFTGFFER